MRILKQYLPGALCALTVLAGACKEEGRDVLFEEDGTWALLFYDIDGRGLEPFDASSRVDKFLVHFDMENEVVATATCVDSMGRTDITQTLCDIGAFECRCFSYTYEKDVMTWTDRPKEGETIADPQTTAINLSVYAEYKSTYLFDALPEGLFNSDGTSSRYVFQSRGVSKFMPTGCLDACGIGQAPVEE